MSLKHVWFNLLVGFALLVGTSPVFAALWDKDCQVAIEEIQQLQKEVAAKKQEVDAARVVAAIPLNFVSDELQDSMKSIDRGQSVTELKALFQNIEFAVSQFSTSCLKSNRMYQ
ncbi:MAG: hypothetical protein O2999_12890 [Nitrospirae bacterium]|nr:hypothetical protein [Nitrospirota bacterium]MDA1305170.1 hypothetical protein [Nitrospirota bacterium]